jgi:hypothetical protein
MTERKSESSPADKNGRDLLDELRAKIKECVDADALDYDGDEGRNAQKKQNAGIDLDDFVMVNGEELVVALSTPSAGLSMKEVCYAIVNAAGKMWISECCIAEEEDVLDAEIEYAQESDPTFRIVPLYTTPPSAKEGRSEWPHGKATNGEVMEEFLTRDEAVWALIDEVRAFRQGVCCLTHSRDPIEIITDKYWGISSREHIARQREIIAKAKATVGPTAKDSGRG